MYRLFTRFLKFLEASLKLIRNFVDVYRDIEKTLEISAIY